MCNGYTTSNYLSFVIRNLLYILLNDISLSYRQDNYVKYKIDIHKKETSEIFSKI